MLNILVTLLIISLAISLAMYISLFANSHILLKEGARRNKNQSNRTVDYENVDYLSGMKRFNPIKMFNYVYRYRFHTRFYDYNELNSDGEIVTKYILQNIDDIKFIFKEKLIHIYVNQFYCRVIFDSEEAKAEFMLFIS